MERIEEIQKMEKEVNELQKRIIELSVNQNFGIYKDLPAEQMKLKTLQLEAMEKYRDALVSRIEYVRELAKEVV